MTLQTEFSWMQSELMKVKEPDLIAAIKSLLKYREKQIQKDWWNEISDEEKAEIEEGIAQADRGELIPHDEIMANPKLK